MICCKCGKPIERSYGRVTDLGNYCRECAMQNEIEAEAIIDKQLYGRIDPEPVGDLKSLFKLIDETMEIRIQHYYAEEYGEGYRLTVNKGTYRNEIFFTKDIFQWVTNEFLYTQIKEHLVDKLNNHIEKEVKDIIKK